jgi:hypothetical protein
MLAEPRQVNLRIIRVVIREARVEKNASLLGPGRQIGIPFVTAEAKTPEFRSKNVPSSGGSVLLIQSIGVKMKPPVE